MSDADFSIPGIGDTFTLSMPPVTTTQLVRYAGASDDYNRIHYDQAFALEAGLGGVIAHGMLTMAFMARAICDWAGPAGWLQSISARFVLPVRPGDVVNVTAKVVGRQQNHGRTEVRCEVTAHVHDKAVALGDATVHLPLLETQSESAEIKMLLGVSPVDRGPQ